MTYLLKMLDIKAFRGASSVVLSDITPVALVVGANNAGKSSVLEAAALALRASDPGQWVKVSRHRDIDMPLVDGLWSLFPGGAAMRLENGPQQSRMLHVEADLRGALRRTLRATCLASESWDSEATSEAILRVEVVIDGAAPKTMEFRRTRDSDWAEARSFKAYTVTPATHRSTKAVVEHLSRVVDEGKKELAVRVLQLFDPDVEDLDVIASLGREAVRVTHRLRGVVDLASFGDGMRRSTVLALALARSAGGVLLIDEIEAGIHHELQPAVFATLFKAAKASSVQLLATTHSLEAVDSVLSCFEGGDRQGELSGYWLQRRGTACEVRRYDFEKLRTLREGGLDIR